MLPLLSLKKRTMKKKNGCEKKRGRTCVNEFYVGFWEKTRLSGAQCFTIPPISITLGWVGDDDKVFTKSW
jgi:hypothetical protein